MECVSVEVRRVVYMVRLERKGFIIVLKDVLVMKNVLRLIVVVKLR